jgi:hypothetical protein
MFATLSRLLAPLRGLKHRSALPLGSGSRLPSGRARLSLLALEDRDTPAVLVVTSAADPNVPAGFSALDPNVLAPGTLRYAVACADADAARGISDTIVFNPNISEITLRVCQLEFTPGSAKTIMTTISGPGVTLDGNSACRVIQVNYGANVALDSLTIQHGTAGSGLGGGILNGGVLTLSNDEIVYNTAAYGGGIFNNGGQVTITGTGFDFNQAAFDGGGLFNNSGQVMIGNPHNASVWGGTFSGNTAAYGGALFNDAGGVTASNCSFQSNSATFSGGAIGNTTGSAILSGDSFVSNNSYYGAAVMNNAGSVEFENGTFLSGNTAAEGVICSNNLEVYTSNQPALTYVLL